MSYESVQEMFSRTAAEYGPQVGIERGERRVTYAELETESNRLANFLHERGVGQGTMVGLFSDDPIWIITSILGVLKAGAVFVPLDPTFPEGRLEVMCEQVRPEWYVTEAQHLEKLSSLQATASSSGRIICLDGTMENYREYQETSSPNLQSDPEAPCSIYFTSGSTGRPKPILGRLKGIDHFIRWEIEAVGAGPHTRVTQFALPSFDGFLKDAFVPLCSGGVVCVPENRDIILDASKLAEWLNMKQIGVLHCVPSLFRTLLNEKLESSYFSALKCVVLVGEPLYPADVKRWLDVFGNRMKLFNIYGTTETSLSKFAYEIKSEDVERPSIPVGKPIKGAAVFLINSRGQLCREEAVGEIHIRTPYRSHGYYNAPELTREVFIQNPFSDDPNDIVHKTGDYGRLLKSGDLEYLGRRDQQVQIRGVRIELGEIENLLRGHQAVNDVAVIDRDDAEGNKFLVAYVTMKNGTGSAILRQYLSEQVPEAMLPSAFVELEKLPRTLNGKIDRKALSALESKQLEGAEDHGPLSPVEEILAGIWCEVLRLPSVGRQGNFFNLGGHSLLMTQVVARVREYLKLELSIRSLFEAPTIEQFARLIETRIRAGGEELEQRLAYWRKQLAGAPQRMSLPLARPRPKEQSFEGATQKLSISLSPELTAALKQLSRREGMTLFMTMLSGFVLLLKMYTGDEDIVVGSVNTQVLRVNLSSAITFKGVMTQVREVCLDAYIHQVPAELLREERDRLPGVLFRLDQQRQEVTSFDLSLALAESEGKFTGAFEYDENLFAASTMDQMPEDYIQLLTLMVADPDGTISTISLTRDDEIEQLSSSFLASLEV